MSKVKLSVLGLSLSESASNAYALILSDEKSKKRIPIIIGSSEAQAIAIELENLKPPRPLTHDLFKNVLLTFSIDMVEVNIYKLEEGIFYSNLVLDSGNKRTTIDSRTSDAVALALRFKCPIYTTEEIVSKSGVFLKMENKEEEDEENINELEESPKNPFEEIDIDDDDSSQLDSKKLKSLSIAELEIMLQQAISNEEYEKASLIKNEISTRKSK